MNEREIKILMKAGALPGGDAMRLVETHISWVLLSKRFAYKIKKPVAFSFLDFSTLAKRKFFCEKELQLNSRLAKDVYLKVIPVRKRGYKICIGEKAGEIIDYAVQMKRLQTAREMDKMLEANKVKHRDVIAIAELLAPFHREAEEIKTPFDIADLKNLFNDIGSVAEFIETKIKNGGRNIIRQAIQKSNDFLKMRRIAFQQRAKDGFIRDCHGDLHSGNIFLYKKPVIFDCLEFNDAFRQIDALNEIAFFCMDLEGHGRNDLSKSFLKHYNKLFPVIRNESDEALFRYYKFYRANIRAKVNALKAMQAKDEVNLKKRMTFVSGYLDLMEKYMMKL